MEQINQNDDGEPNSCGLGAQWVREREINLDTFSSVEIF